MPCRGENSLYTTHSLIGSQCSSRRAQLMWSRGLTSSTTRAATHKTRCNGARVDAGRCVKQCAAERICHDNIQKGDWIKWDVKWCSLYCCCPHEQQQIPPASSIYHPLQPSPAEASVSPAPPVLAYKSHAQHIPCTTIFWLLLLEKLMMVAW